MIIRLYTDGACSGNPGPGGWAIIASMPHKCVKYWGCERNTTNNRMELTAVLECLKKVLKMSNKEIKFEVYSDSAYVLNAINNKWIYGWAKSGWVTRQKDHVKNKDLWEQVLTCLQAIEDLKVDITFIKVKGHSGDQFNELCDKLAKEAASHSRIVKFDNVS